MMNRLLFAACFCACLLPFNAFCEAEVVDDSENFALLEEQQAPYESPVAHDDNEDRSSYSNNNTQDEPPLAKENNPTHDRSNGYANLLDKVQGLQQEVQELRGQLDVQAHDLKLLQEQQLSFYKDLDARLRDVPVKGMANKPLTAVTIGEKPIVATTSPETSIQPAAMVMPPVQPVIGAGRTNPANEQISYLAAYELVKDKQFDEALTAMQTFVTKYPHGGYSANAQYWLGELYMVKNDYLQAIEHFNVVMQEFPSSSKNAASLLKVGYALAGLGKTAEARAKLQEVVKTFPDTSAAKLATAKLNTLRTQ